MSNARRMLSGAVWIYGAQVGTAAAQFFYAMATSRLLTPASFEDYAVGLSGYGLASILANAGLAQSVQRLDVVNPSVVRGLFTYSMFLGALLSVLLLITADIWAQFWGVPGSGGVIRVLSLAVLFAPAGGLLQGLSRRSGDFRFLSLGVLLTNIVGMGVGVALIAISRSSSALAASMVLAQWLLAGVFLYKYRSLAAGFTSLRGVRKELSFTWKLLGSSLVGYFNGNVGKYAVANVLPLGALGYWNRADVVTTVPLMQAQNALVSAAYPEFRHARVSSAESALRWSDMVVLAAWVSLPLGVGLSAAVPFVVPYFFGTGWSTAASLAGPLALAGCLQIPATLLSSAIEALGKFRSLYIVQLLLTVVYLVSATTCWLTHSWWPILIGLVAAPILQHAFQLWWASQGGWIQARRVLREYLLLAVVLVPLYFGVHEAVFGVVGGASSSLILGLTVVIGLVAVVVLLRESVAPVSIARRRGLLRSPNRSMSGARHRRAKAGWRR